MKRGKEVARKRMTLHGFDVNTSPSHSETIRKRAMLTAALDGWAILWKSKEPRVTSRTLWATDSTSKDSVAMTYRDGVREVLGPQKAWDLTET